jgi:uncharacterized membrane protein YphA (DoxX/SURF4 family)
LGFTLQRLFSTFPNSWPGVGLLLLRLCLAIALLYVSAPGVANGSEVIVLAQVVPAVGGFLLLVGLWTPVVATVVAFDQVCIAFSLYSLDREETWIHIFLALLAVSVGMLGPGAWSIDARLFGRQRFEIDRTRGRKSSL